VTGCASREERCEDRLHARGGFSPSVRVGRTTTLVWAGDIERIDGGRKFINYQLRQWPGKLMCMNTTTPKNARGIWSRILTMVGSIAMLVGAIDPMEGSLLILPGSGLVALGTFLGQGERRLIAYRVAVFLLISIGVGAMWGLSSVGGFGGPSGRSNWWGLLILPYLVGWTMGIWGPSSPRWVLWLGIGVGLWYQAILVMVLLREGGHHVAPVFLISALGLATIVGCVSRLRQRIA
jgi:hypothetical protein